LVDAEAVPFSSDTQFGFVELTTGIGLTSTVRLFFTTTAQPSFAVTVTEYSVVIFGETERILFISPLSHLKEEPPVTDNKAVDPAQIIPSLFINPDVSVTIIDATGISFTIIVPIALTIPQPPVNGIL
jgi:hypothetical protein